MRVGVREIARRTGLSPATVSNALNHKPGVSQATVERVMAAAKDLDPTRQEDDPLRFSPKLESVRFLVARRSGQIVDMSTFRTMLENGIEGQSRRHGLTMSYETLSLLGPDPRAEVAALAKDTTAATILLATEMEEEDYRLFDSFPGPLVVVDGWSNFHNFECVVTTNEISAYQAAKHLIDHHHTRIGYIMGSIRTKSFPHRERGLVAAFADAGLTLEDRYRVDAGNSPEDAYQAMRAWLATHDDRPTAFFADTDSLAMGALRAFSEAGVRVPEDISLIGFDDLTFAAFTNPPLTTIRVPIREMGEMAVRKAVRQVKTPRDYRCVTRVGTTFVERATVRDLG